MGEFLGPLAVVATLFYLALQIRQNTLVSKADMTKDLFLASRSALLDVSGNPELAKIYAEIQGFEDKDFSKRRTFFQSFFRLYELQFSMKSQGLLDENIAQSYMLVIRMWVGSKLFDEYWKVSQHGFNDDFRAYVDEQRKIVAEKVPI